MLKLGHRGAPGAHRYQENTLASFQRALLSGADGIEFDVCKTRDNELIVFHGDDALEPLTGKKGSLTDLTIEDIRQLRVHGEPIPTLGDVLDEYGKLFKVLNIEIKNRGISELVQKHVSIKRREWNVLVSSLHEEDLTAFKTLYPRVQTGLLLSATEENKFVSTVARAHSLGVATLHIEYQALSEPAIEHIHSLGFLVYAWTVNERNDIERLKRWGVDGIISDFPSRL